METTTAGPVVPQSVKLLVERFDANRGRRAFIDPLFKALGWDVDNEADYAEAYNEVIFATCGKTTVSGARIDTARRFVSILIGWP